METPIQSEEQRTTPARIGKLPALGEGLVMSVLLGSTLVLVKASLHTLGPFTLAAYRYVLAALILLPIVLHWVNWRSWTPHIWRQFILIGLCFYAVSNAALFLTLRYLPAATASLLLSFVPLMVLLGGMFWLHEMPTRVQLTGIGIAVIGSILFFSSALSPGQPMGFLLMVVCLAGNVSLPLLGRDVAQDVRVPALALTAVPIAFGGLVLLPIALVVEGPPSFSIGTIAVIACLALLNTVGVFLLYSHLLTVLTAFEVTTFTSLTPLITALGGWFFLDERLALWQIIGMIVVVLGVVAVQIGKMKSS